ncbi:MAG: Ig-like domain-containing protein [Bacteroidaceae bacterium]|nr:Ig-like domain-containing protein [Bacteroidaceae bacterium]
MKEWRPLLYSILSILVVACASLGSPDGGEYDEIPPKVISASPMERATGVQTRKARINFDEYIKLENASEKVIVSPPQIEPANIRADGKHIKIELKDTLKENTTYTIDFSDAIEDNNEGNPMGNYTYSFSTGDDIDTMEVAGTVLNAEDLEPVKGILVGLYPVDSNLTDSILKTIPFNRVSRTNGSGRFSIKGVKRGKYRVYALDDKDGNFIFSQKSEKIAFDSLVFETSCKRDVRMDTIWRDTVQYDSIRVVPYTHFLPDDLVLLSFLEDGQDQHLLKKERTEPEFFRLFFTAPADTLPTIRGLNFDEKCLLCEASEHNDTLTYWITDTTYYRQQDTLTFEISFLETDTTGVLSPHTETLELFPKNTWEKKWKEQSKKIEEWNKEREKKIRKAKKPLAYEENPYLKTYLDISCKPTGSLDPIENPRFTAKEPLASVDSTKIHFYIKEDSDWVPHPYLFLPDKKDKKVYTLYAEWDSKNTYRFVADSAAFTSVMGNSTKPRKYEFRVKEDEEFGSIFIHVIAKDSNIIVQLLNHSDKPVATQKADKDGRADFFYMKPGDYYVRCFIDSNNNGVWDTGNYSEGRRPEEVFYFPKKLSLKANWDLEQEWAIRSIARNQQKPQEITKQKADKQKNIKQRNLQRKMEKNKNDNSASQKHN